MACSHPMFSASISIHRRFEEQFRKSPNAGEPVPIFGKNNSKYRRTNGKKMLKELNLYDKEI